MATIELKNVIKRYGSGKTANQVIHGVNAQIADGEFIVWSQSYDRPLDDLPMIRDDIVSHVVEELQSQGS